MPWAVSASACSRVVITNAEGEEQGVYEPGYVVVTREAKQKLLAASAALRQAKDDVARQAAWDDFAKVAKPLLAGE